MYCNEPQVTVGGVLYEKTEDGAWEELWATVAGECASTTRTLRSMQIKIQAAGREVGRDFGCGFCGMAEASAASWRGEGLEVEILYSKNNTTSEDEMCEI